MARLPDLIEFGREHGSEDRHDRRSDQHRSRTESLVEKLGSRSLNTAFGEFVATAFRDKPSGALHLALVKGAWQPEQCVDVRVHEPLSVLDALEVGRAMHSWSLEASLRHITDAGAGVAVLLNCGESAAQLLAQFEGTARSAQAPERGRMDLRTYGVGAQILRESGVQKMRLMGNPRRMPSMTGYGLEVGSFVEASPSLRAAAPTTSAAALAPGAVPGSTASTPSPLGLALAGRLSGTRPIPHPSPRDAGRRPRHHRRDARRGPARGHRARALQRRHHPPAGSRLPSRARAAGACRARRRRSTITVPGALEVPLALKALADAGDCDALIALGCVIRGETYHFELVANESGAGVTRVIAGPPDRRSPTPSSPSRTKTRPGHARSRQGP
jgi:GTP cyclohydrolase II